MASTTQTASPQTFKEWCARTRNSAQRLLDMPITSYYLILFAVILLVGFGLLMVLSASSITAYDAGAGSSFSVFTRQAIFAVIGLAVMWLLSFLRIETWKKLAAVFLVVSLALQVLPLTPLGVDVNGNRSWIQITSNFRIQPAELVKLALPLYIGVFMHNRYKSLKNFSAVVPVLFILMIAVGLVVLGHDVGTAIVLFATGFGALLVGGLPWRWITVILGVAATGAVAVVLSSTNRMARIQALITGHNSEAADTLGTSWQSNHGLYALASGGLTGVGLGASREKWAWLPEAHNDFIFAIIGEELGLLGAFAVIGLFGVLGYGITRLVVRTEDRFVQTAAAGIFGWFIGQAAINMAVVTGVAPVIGLPLPFVSYGGSSLVAALIAVGMLLSFARNEAGARDAMKARAQTLRHSLSIVSSRKD